MEASCIFPPQDLAPIVDRVWAWESQPREWIDLPLIGPGVGAELILSLGTPPRSSEGPLPRHLLLNQRGRALFLERQQGLHLIALRIRAGTLRHLLPCPVEELGEGFQDAETIWGSSLQNLREHLGNLGRFEDQGRLFLEWARSQRNRNLRPDRPIQQAVERLYHSPHGLSLDSCCRTAELGVRQFQRRFRQATGLAPKEFQQRVRLYRILRSFLLSPSTRILDLALDQGFFDQPHFHHTFRQITGLSPGAYLREAQARTHFYNPPR